MLDFAPYKAPPSGNWVLILVLFFFVFLGLSLAWAFNRNERIKISDKEFEENRYE